MRYLGVDFGLKRIGFAQSEGFLAAPLKVLEVSNFQDALNKIKSLAKDFDKVVIGKPEGEMGKKVTKLIQILKKEGIDTAEWDETLSTKNALKATIEIGIGKKKRQVVDAYSASLILQDYLDFR